MKFFTFLTKMFNGEINAETSFSTPGLDEVYLDKRRKDVEKDFKGGLKKF